MSDQWADYFKDNEIESSINGLAEHYKLICTRITLPYKTASEQPREIYALRIGRKGATKPKGVLFTGCHHAREWGGAEICLAFAADILESYMTNTNLHYGNKMFSAEQIRQIINDLDIFVVPCVNRDGRDFSRQFDDQIPVEGLKWRKNRNPRDSGGNPACLGVDLNRNYDFVWNLKQHFHPEVIKIDSLGSDEPCNFQYHGPNAHSEDEVKNIVWLLDTYPHIQYYIDIHSYGKLILYPWGDSPNQNNDVNMNFQNPAFHGQRGLFKDNNGNLIPDVYAEYIPTVDLAIFKQKASRINNAIHDVRGNSYNISQGIYLYATSGTAQDYAYSRHFINSSNSKIFSYTIEFGESGDYTPDWPEMCEVIKEIDAGLIEFCLNTQITAKLTFKCVEETSEVAPSDSPYFLIYIGDTQSQASTVKLIRRQSWDDMVDSEDPPFYTTIPFPDMTNFDIVLIALLEEDWDLDSNLGHNVQNAMRVHDNLLQPGVAENPGFIFIMKTHFNTAISSYLVNDDLLDIQSFRLPQTRHFYGGGGHYKVTFEII